MRADKEKNYAAAKRQGTTCTRQVRILFCRLGQAGDDEAAETAIGGRTILDQRALERLGSAWKEPTTAGARGGVALQGVCGHRCARNEGAGERQLVRKEIIDWIAVLRARANHME